jgi:hypothetical protein
MSTTPSAPVESSAPPAVSATPPATSPAASTPPASSGTAAAVATPPTAATPPAVTEPVAAPAGDFSDLLAEDLKPLVAEPVAAPGAADDLATKYKDDPAVQALIAEKTAFAPISKVIQGNRYAIPNPEELKLQLEDSNTLYDIAAGKKPASSLLETMLANPQWSQEQKNAIIADIAQFIAKKTGQPIAAAAAGQPTIEDPAMAEIKKIRAEQQAEKDRQAQEAFTVRVNTAKTTLSTKVSELLTGTWLEGESDYVMALLGQKFAGADKAMEVVAAVERGDFAPITKALQAIKNEEATRYVARNKRMIELQKKKGATIPAQVAAGSPAAPAAEPGNIVELDPDKRRAAMLASYRSGQ